MRTKTVSQVPPTPAEPPSRMHSPMQSFEPSLASLHSLGEGNRSTERSNRVVHATRRAMDDLLGGEGPSIDDGGLLGRDGPTTFVRCGRGSR